MAKIRIGNDIAVTWTLKDGEGNPYDLTGRNVEVHLRSFYVDEQMTFEVTGASHNVVSFTFYGKDQRAPGKYNLLLIENKREVAQVVFDVKDVFELVKHSWETDDESAEGITTESVQIVSTVSEGIVGPRGLTGNGIASAVLNPDYTLTLNFTDGTSYTTPSIRGAQGEQGIQGLQGIQGDTGNGIASAVLNADYTLTLTFTDGTTYTTPSIRGPQGPKGDKGEDSIFWATYGTTTGAEIDAAIAEGKTVYCKYGSAYSWKIYRLASRSNFGSSQMYEFTCIKRSENYRLNLLADNWSADTTYLIDTDSIGTVREYTDITYSELVEMRNNWELVRGAYYRITDYVTTTTDTESRSLAHPFDIIVQALDASHLSEEALAAHNDDDDDYFADTNFAAWKIWYCLDNDTTRFAWADTTNGKGVIYRMIDEFGNDVPYDFKNIQFKRYKVTAKTAYTVSSQSIDLTASLGVCNGLYIGLSGTKSRGFDIDSSDYKWYFTFSRLGSTWDADIVDASLTGAGADNNTYGAVAYNGATELNNIVNANGQVVTDFRKGINSSIPSDYYFTDLVAVNSHFGEGIRDIMHLGFCGNCFFESSYRNNIAVGTCQRHCTGGSNVQNNTIVAIYDNCFNTLSSNFGNNVYTIKGRLCWCEFLNYVNNNFAYVTGEYGNCTNEQEFSNNVIFASTVQANSFIGVFANNTVGTASAVANFQRCAFGAVYQQNKMYGEFRNVRTHGQVNNNTFNAVVACTFDCILSYITVPSGTGTFSLIDIKGNVRGTSSVPITLDASQFRISSLTGVNRRITIEGQADGKITATWMEGGKRVGIYKTQGAAWTALPSMVEAAGSVTKIWTGTQAQYDALTPASDTLYLITPAQ